MLLPATDTRAVPTRLQCASLRAASGDYGGRLAYIAHGGRVVARISPIKLRMHEWVPISLEVSPEGW